MCSLSLEPTRAFGTDHDSVCNESTLDNGTCFNNNTRHQDTVDDLGTMSTDFDTCETVRNWLISPSTTQP